MITFEQLMVARYQAEITKIKRTAFSDQDVINLILQRSEIIKDQTRSGKAVKDWTQGDATQLRSIAEKLGDDLIYRAAGIIWLEYMEIFESIQTLSTLKVADIGCGYALFDYFLYEDFKSDIFLIDIEETKERHFGFSKSGAAYSSLPVARQFLQDNGVPTEKIFCLNPEQDNVMDLPEMDLVVSFISCGFHYPVATYDNFFKNRIRPGGGIILDVRAQRFENQKPILENYGTTKILTKAANGKAMRLFTVRGKDHSSSSRKTSA